MQMKDTKSHLPSYHKYVFLPDLENFIEIIDFINDFKVVMELPLCPKNIIFLIRNVTKSWECSMVDLKAF